jgi:hypothetical protein
MLEQYINRRAGELGVAETVTPYVLEELKRQQRELEEAKALATAGRGGKGSGRKRQDIRTLQTGSTFRLAQRQHARAAGKKLDVEVKKLADHLQKQIRAYQNEKISFKRLETRTSIAFKSTIETIFKLGMKAVGLVKPTGSAYDLTASERKWIKSYLDEELGYFKRFLKQLKGKESKNRRDIQRRTELYANALKSVYEAGRVLSVGPNVLVTWKLESKNPCPDCKLIHRYNPYTPDTLPTTPKAGQTRCRAYCYCTLEIKTATPSAVKRVRKRHRSANWLLRKIRDQQKRKA